MGFFKKEEEEKTTKHFGVRIILGGYEHDQNTNTKNDAEILHKKIVDAINKDDKTILFDDETIVIKNIDSFRIYDYESHDDCDYY